MKRFMVYILIFATVSLLAGFAINTQMPGLYSDDFPELSGPYLGQTPPGLISEVFAPGIVSSNEWGEHCQLAISPDGNEIFWSAWSGKYKSEKFPENSEQLYYSRIENGKWTQPRLAEFTKGHLDGINGGPVFTPDGKRLYFYSSDRPGGLGDLDVWYVEKKDGKWGEPVNPGEPINSRGVDWTPYFSRVDHAFVFSGGVKKFKYKNGEFSSPEKLVLEAGYNPLFPSYVSPDESYLIFSCIRGDGYGGLDLYISFKDDQGRWGKPVNMGDKINTAVFERFPVVSPDGRFLFFMRQTEPDHDIYWVSTEIIEKLREEAGTVKN